MNLNQTGSISRTLGERFCGGCKRMDECDHARVVIEGGARICVDCGLQECILDVPQIGDWFKCILHLEALNDGKIPKITS